jgi:hypothetical protein
MPKQTSRDPRVNVTESTPRAISPVKVVAQQAPFASIERAAPASQTSAGRLVNFLASTTPALQKLVAERNEKEMEAGVAQTVAFQRGMSKLAGEASAIRKRNEALAEFEQNKDAYASGEKNIQDLVKQKFTLEGIEDRDFKGAAMPVLLRASAELNAKHREASSQFVIDQRKHNSFQLADTVARDVGATEEDVTNLTTKLHDQYGLSRPEAMELYMESLQIAATQGNVQAFEKFIKQATKHNVGVASTPKHKADFYRLLEQAKRVAAGTAAKMDHEAKSRIIHGFGERIRNGERLRYEEILQYAKKPDGSGFLEAGEIESIFNRNEDAYRTRGINDATYAAYRYGDSSSVNRAATLDGNTKANQDRQYNQVFQDLLLDPKTGGMKQGPELQGALTELNTIMVRTGEVPPALRSMLLNANAGTPEQLAQAYQVYANLESISPSLLPRILDSDAIMKYRIYGNAVQSNRSPEEALEILKQFQDPQRRERAREMFAGKAGAELALAVRDEIADESWYWFGRDEVRNADPMSDRVVNKAKELRALGASQEEAISEAGKWFKANHIRVGDYWIPADMWRGKVDVDDLSDYIGFQLETVSQVIGLPVGDLTVAPTPYSRAKGQLSIIDATTQLPIRHKGTGQPFVFDLKAAKGSLEKTHRDQELESIRLRWKSKRDDRRANKAFTTFTGF